MEKRLENKALFFFFPAALNLTSHMARRTFRDPSQRCRAVLEGVVTYR